MITIGFTGNSHKVPLKTSKFLGGEIQASLNLPIRPATYEVIARLNSSDDIMELLLLDEILRRHHQYDSHLLIPYLPYGRQDRVMLTEEAFSLKVMSKLLNSLCFKDITTYDCHSPVTNALVDNLIELDQSQIIAAYGSEKFIELIHQSLLVAPDAGAIKKIFKIAKCFKRPMVVAEKIRNTSTGEIIATKIDITDFPLDMPILMIDDICDGGRTFVELAKSLRNQGSQIINLYITHGIFSKGLDVFDGLIDHIYTTDTFKVQEEHPRLTTFHIVEDI